MKSLYDILSTFGDKYLTGKEMNKARIIQDIDRYDEELIMALLSEDLIKKHYAKKLENIPLLKQTNSLKHLRWMIIGWIPIQNIRRKSA